MSELQRENTNSTRDPSKRDLNKPDKVKRPGNITKRTLRQKNHPPEASVRLVMILDSQNDRQIGQQANVKIDNRENFGRPIEIAVLARNYPKAILDPHHLSELKESIVTEMSYGWKYKLQFAGIRSEPGMLLIQCVTSRTAEWLVQNAPCLATWTGPPLTTRVGNDIPKSQIIKLVLPRDITFIPSFVINLIDVQNEDLHPRSWNVIHVQNYSRTAEYIIQIDEYSHQMLLKKGGQIYFLFSKFFVETVDHVVICTKPQSCMLSE